MIQQAYKLPTETWWFNLLVIDLHFGLLEKQPDNSVVELTLFVIVRLIVLAAKMPHDPQHQLTTS